MAAPTADTRRRALIVLLSAAGESGERIAATLGVTRRTVANARTRWQRRGLRALSPANSWTGPTTSELPLAVVHHPHAEDPLFPGETLATNRQTRV
jgi:transposase